ncbi:MAG: N-acetyl-gamma-glutamyl-phosphate reductase [Candidatus Anaerobiospirillum merdipullorum]|uniref:N-acetyl-gamma-glutamyl-phosphate reductase n=1 Tax=Candidatus Anaerobiospirillum merdipullorum TaxID=2838450 RepID=A0A9E2KPL0_9GAMM|nr:N-acetyl-gamma-glutamyl-phosphate reductase [Candidatus Anaerobiospirillum merdipullorum]
MLKAAIVGASGYAGHQLALLCTRHPEIELTGLYVSPNSQDKDRRIDSLYGDLSGRCALPLQGLSLDKVPQVAQDLDVVFLATEHKTAHDEAPLFIAQGCCVCDLSGAYRVPERSFYERYYGFSHEHPELLAKAVYGLCEWCDPQALKEAQLISLPGCYPTASELALKPLYAANLLDESIRPVINAVSGVSGSGRKASLTNSFCEVSLNAYGLFTHRHQPEISYHVGHEVIFNPHLGNFKRGILATITAKLKQGATVAQCKQALDESYRDHPLVRVKEGTVKLQDVQGLPCCDLSVCGDDEYIVISSAIDNLLKGAAAQAMQACNLHFGFKEDCALW